MNKEEILNTFLLANIPEIITQEEFNDVKKAIKYLQQENKILKENAENNDKVVDKVNWENQLLKKEIHQLKVQLESSEKARKEAIDKLKKWGEEPDYDMCMKMKEYKEHKEVLDILDIDKGE